MTNTSIIPYSKQSIDSSDIAAVENALKSKWITRGPQVEAFEREVADFCGASFAVAFNSGTSALSAACYAIKTNAYDRVITTPNSFIASVGTAMQFGAQPVFVDIDPKTANVNIDQMAYNASQPSSRGKPILIPVHFAGIPVNIEQLDSNLKNPEAVIIEDAAHALGSHYPNNGPKVGSCTWSSMTIFSFHPAKTITTGEGGMVTTNDEKLFHRLKLFRNNGIEREPKFLEGEPQPWYYEIQDITDNHNFTEFQAALGLSQFKRLNQFISKRLELMKIYKEKLRDWPHVRMLTPDFEDNIAFHLCVVQIDFEALKISRAKVMQKLHENHIGTQVHYIPLYRHPYFVKKYGDVAAFFPHMEAYYSQALSLPLYFDLTTEDIDRVLENLKEALRI